MREWRQIYLKVEMASGLPKFVKHDRRGKLPEVLEPHLGRPLRAAAEPSGKGALERVAVARARGANFGHVLTGVTVAGGGAWEVFGMGETEEERGR